MMVHADGRPSIHTTRAYPAPGTARAAVLDALCAGRTLTSLEAWREFGTSRLAADVHALRRMGWPIVATETPAVACRGGRSARIATYRMTASLHDHHCPASRQHQVASDDTTQPHSYMTIIARLRAGPFFPVFQVP